MHEGHRERMRERYLQNGIDALAPHEVLELLLYYSQPRVNTNETAHHLLDSFHSIRGVLDADADALCRVKGMGKNSAILLTLIKDIVNIYNRGNLNPRPYVLTAMEAGIHIRRLIGERSKEAFYVFCLDGDGRIFSHRKVAEGSASGVNADISLIVEYALTHGAACIILAHNHPMGPVDPSENDILFTKKVQEAFKHLNIFVTDHIIVGDGYFYSMAAHCLL